MPLLEYIETVTADMQENDTLTIVGRNLCPGIASMSRCHTHTADLLRSTLIHRARHRNH